jgi:hypothetical protein
LSAELLRATVANTPDDADSELFVLVPEFDGGQHKWGPCIWQPHTDDTLPTRGDDALVAHDDLGDTWVIAWTAT